MEWGARGVWAIPSVRSNADHDSKFPLELPRRAVRLFTDPGDLVLDCFIGSGTSAVAAIAEGRRYLGIEKEKKSVVIARRAVETASAQVPRPATLMARDSQYKSGGMAAGGRA